MKKCRSGRFIVLLLVIFFILTISAHATQYNRGSDSLGHRLIYDSDLNITWYDYTQSQANWQTQMNWADGLDVDFNGTHYTDWRLPSTVDGPEVYGYDGTTTAGFNITSSEMGHLYYTELGNLGEWAIDGTNFPPGYGLKNVGDFQNLQQYAYWSGTQYAAYTGLAWYLNLPNGYQGTANKD
ncbi:MAG: hypothetical protein Q7T74_00175, partial [Candidatus Saccharibacteria bacterium]|nr:hypothetical protein [Candidatus Saccharibacteria bacterium]